MFYQSQAIVRQGLKGTWDFKLDAVYGIFFANFFLDGRENGKLRRDVGLADLETGEVFCDKIRQIYIELPYFIKDEDECETDFERWIYVLKNMEILERMPFKGRKAVFDRLEQMASKANMTVAERQQYEEEWKNANDYYNTLDYAKKEAQAEGRAIGLAEGRAEGRAEGLAEGLMVGERNALLRTVKGLREKGLSASDISDVTGLPLTDIENL